MRDNQKQTDLRGFLATMLVLVVCAAAQIGYLVLIVQKNPRPAAGLAIKSSFTSPERDHGLARAPRRRSLSPATSAPGMP